MHPKPRAETPRVSSQFLLPRDVSCPADATPSDALTRFFVVSRTVRGSRVRYSLTVECFPDGDVGHRARQGASCNASRRVRTGPHHLAGSSRAGPLRRCACPAREATISVGRAYACAASGSEVTLASTPCAGCGGARRPEDLCVVGQGAHGEEEMTPARGFRSRLVTIVDTRP